MCLDLSSKKRCLLRLFTYHLKAHTISNKVVLKVFAQKKGGKSYDSSNMCSNFGQISVLKGRLYHLLPKFEHIFVAVITFTPFFCADTFITSLLFIVCALR